jgi:hypothetical protein
MKRKRERLPCCLNVWPLNTSLRILILGLVTISFVVDGDPSRTNDNEPQWLQQQQRQPQQEETLPIDVCSLVDEENHIGRLYIDFIGTQGDISDDDITTIEELLLSAYQEASSEHCQDGYRYLFGVEIDRDFIMFSEAKNQFRVPVNVLSRCKGCSQDLRFFSIGSADRLQGRFLEDPKTRNQLGGFSGEKKRESVLFDSNEHQGSQVEPFLNNPRCFCPPPSRERILDRLRQATRKKKETGKLQNFQEIAGVGAYFSGLTTRQSPEGEKRIVRSERNATGMTFCSLKPPFSEPFPIPDLTSFQGITSCPFFLHEHVMGQPVETCFPIYDVPLWYHQDSVSFMLQQVTMTNILFFEKQQIFATWEELVGLAAADGTVGVQSCLDRLDFEAVGVFGEISGEAGTASLSTIVASFMVEGEDNTKHLLLPFGGCEDSVYGKEHTSSRKDQLEENRMTPVECSLQLDTDIDDETCMEQCVSNAENDYTADLRMLQKLREAKMFKNKLNAQAVTNKLILKRAADVTMVLAQCLCNSDLHALAQCLLDSFLEVVATETDERFEALEIFGAHGNEAQEDFVKQQQAACTVARESGMTCLQACKS